MLRYCCLLVSSVFPLSGCKEGIRTILFEPVYITLTSKTLIGNHFFASPQSKGRNEITPAVFTAITHPTHTRDWIVRSRKFMEKLAPETTYCDVKRQSVSSMNALVRNGRTLFTTVMRMEARQ